MIKLSKPNRADVVLVSGGLDSATVLAEAHLESMNIICIHFNYGAPTEAIELDRAKKLAKHYKLPLTVIDIHNVISKGGLVEKGKDFTKSVDASGVSTGYVPFRNLLLATIAAGVGTSHCDTNGTVYLWLGAQATDDAAYADCRPSFIKAAEKALDLSTDTQSIKIVTPIQKLTKVEVLKRALELDVPVHLTYSCYRPIGGKVCGGCGACEERTAAFQELGIEDLAASMDS